MAESTPHATFSGFVSDKSMVFDVRAVDLMPEGIVEVKPELRHSMCIHRQLVPVSQHIQSSHMNSMG